MTLHLVMMCRYSLDADAVVVAAAVVGGGVLHVVECGFAAASSAVVVVDLVADCVDLFVFEDISCVVVDALA